MTAKIIPFKFKDNQVRTIEITDLIWFIANDVARILGFRDSSNMTRMLDEDEKGTHNMSTPGGDQEVAIINESGLYHALLKSRKPEAKPFRKWVTAEVLPAIRRNGQYQSADVKTKKALPNGLSLEQCDSVKALVKARVEACPKEHQAQAAITCWSALKSKFGCTYKEIHPDQFPEALSLVARLPLEGEFIPADEPTDLRQAMIGPFCDGHTKIRPLNNLPDAVAVAVEAKAFELAVEAKNLIADHIRYRLAWEKLPGKDIAQDAPRIIAKVSLNQALTYRHHQALFGLELVALRAQEAAQQILSSLPGARPGGNA